MSIPLEKPRDPLVPRPIDLPTPVPLEPDAELDGLDAAKIFAAPDDPADWPAWREALTRWRAEAAERIEYDDSAYRAPEFAWTRGCFSVALVWLWDELLYDFDVGSLHARAVLRRVGARVRRLRRRSSSGTRIP